MPPTHPNPTFKALDGTWFDYHNNHDAPLTGARWVTREGHEAFHLSGQSVEGPWSLRLARKHDEYYGDWIYDGETQRYRVMVRLYQAVHGEEDEWILLGTWTESGCTPLPLSIRLWPDDDR